MITKGLGIQLVFLLKYRENTHSLFGANALTLFENSNKPEHFHSY